MILGLSLPQFTLLHVGISLIAIIAGLVAMAAFAGGRRYPVITAVFLLLTALTSLTGFIFPIKGLTPALVTGVVSMLVLIVAFLAIYGYGLRGKAGIVYAVSATIALWLNLFVWWCRLSSRCPRSTPLRQRARNRLSRSCRARCCSAPLVQGAVLLGMIALGWAAVRTVRRPVLAV